MVHCSLDFTYAREKHREHCRICPVTKKAKQNRNYKVNSQIHIRTLTTKSVILKRKTDYNVVSVPLLLQQ